MSGNPFRKAGDSNARQPLRNPAAPPREESIRKGMLSGQPFIDEQASLHISTVVKKVQFVSPVTSPEIVPRQPRPDSAPGVPEIPDLPIAASTTQPPPPNGLASDETGIDTRALLRGDPTGGGTIDLAGPTPTINSTTAASSTSYGDGAPINPFAKRLATMELEQRAAAVLEIASKGRPEIAQPTPARSTMDVDAFKRLLMTGTSGISMTPTEPARQESTSTTGTSNTQQQSPYETVHEPDPESPHSSLESASSDEATKINTQNTAINKTAESKVGDLSSGASQPPPLPVHRHGKPVEPKAPQTVSFDDFDSAFADFGKELPATGDVPGGRPTLSRSMSDLNKPLPNPPTLSMSGLQISSTGIEPQVATEPVVNDVPNEDVQKKIPPPPPPTARRQAQPKKSSPNPSSLEQPSAGRSRSGSNLSQISTRSEESTMSKASNRPVPPPPRQPIPVSGDSTSDTVTSNADQATLSSSKMRPPPPPSRQAARPPTQITRTPSSQSSSSLQNRRASTHGGLAPPPPPPPRRGAPRSTGEDTSGIHSRRSSGQSIGSERKDSVSSLQRSIEERADEIVKHAVDAQLPPANLLADLDAFQREVDALRAKALKGA